MRDRVQGTENEYVVMRRAGKNRFENPPDFLNLPRRRRSGEPPSILSQSEKYEKKWFINGGAAYIDQSAYPEYATPECRRIRDVVLHDRAGEKIIQKIFHGFAVFKNNIAQGEGGGHLVSVGCHENYFMLGEFDFRRGEFVDMLAPFLLSRQTLCGSGWIDDLGNFYLSQRSFFVETKTGSGNVNTRPLIYSSSKLALQELSERHASRLHLTLGDSNILEYTTFLKIGITALVLAMIEDGFAPSFDCKDHLKSVMDVNRDISGREKTIYFREGGAVSALEMQWNYLCAAQKYLSKTDFESEESEREAKKIIAEWEASLNAYYSKNAEWLLGRLDNQTKHFLIFGDSKNRVSIAEKRRRDLGYHHLGANDDLNKFFKDRRVLTDGAINKATHCPPKDTRAYARGKAIASILERNRRVSGCTIEWHSILFKDVNTLLSDPMDRNPESVKYLYERLKGLKKKCRLKTKD